MSTIDERWNIVDTTRAFCQKVLPLVYDESLSYMELVCKLSSKLNEVIENNNNIPQYVKELIKETVNSDEFAQIVGSVLMDTIINVKFPPEGITPAKGDSVTDDTTSIQACLDYANSQGGAVVFFPSGKYLTGTLSINTETSILGADRYNTSLVLKGGGNTPLLQGVINQSVRNICLDGNRLNQVEENYLIDGTIDMALFDNVILRDSAHCITADACNDSEFCNVLCKDISDGVFITAAGNNNLLANINTKYVINLTGNNNNWQSAKQTKIDSVEPLSYKEPQKLNDYFDFITFKHNNNIYDVLVKGEGLNELGRTFIVPVEQYGAVGDGITDDTNAIQAAITESSGKFIVLMAQKYKITSTIQINAPTTIWGERSGQIISTGECFNITSDAYYTTLKDISFKSQARIITVGAEQVTISGCHFSCNPPEPGTSAIIVHRANCIIEQCHFDIFNCGGVFFQPNTQNLLINCTITNSYFGGTGNNAIMIAPPDDGSIRAEGIIISDNRFITTGKETITIYSGLSIIVSNNIIDQSSDYGISISKIADDIDTVKISNNYFGQTGQYSAAISITGEHSSARINVSNNQFFNTYNGIYVNGSGTGKNYSMIISGNYMLCSSRGIKCNSIEDIIVCENNFGDNLQPVDILCKNIVFTNNIFKGTPSITGDIVVNENNVIKS
jgi:hypothetical protein